MYGVEYGQMYRLEFIEGDGCKPTKRLVQVSPVTATALLKSAPAKHSKLGFPKTEPNRNWRS